jgi:hypothetical protein
MSWNRNDSEKLAAAFVKEGLLEEGKPLTDLFSEEYDESLHDEMVTGADFEAKYGWYEQLQNIAKTGIVFAGWNAEGGEYRPSEWCSWKGKYYEVMCATDTGPVVRVNENGNVDRRQLASVRRYQKAVKKAYEYMKGTKPPKRRQ